VAVVDKHRVNSAHSLIEEQSLPVVYMPSAHVDEPRQPEILTIPNTPQAAAGKDFVYAGIFAKQSGTEAKTSIGTEDPSNFWPTPLISLQE